MCVCAYIEITLFPRSCLIFTTEDNSITNRQCAPRPLLPMRYDDLKYFGTQQIFILAIASAHKHTHTHTPIHTRPQPFLFPINISSSRVLAAATTYTTIFRFDSSNSERSVHFWKFQESEINCCCRRHRRRRHRSRCRLLSNREMLDILRLEPPSLHIRFAKAEELKIDFSSSFFFLHVFRFSPIHNLNFKLTHIFRAILARLAHCILFTIYPNNFDGLCSGIYSCSHFVRKSS